MSHALVQLTKNENQYGPSPKCYDIIKNLTVEDYIFYSRESVGVIENEISKSCQLPAEQIILGYGAEDIIKNLFTHYIFPGDNVLIPDLSWWYYKALVEQRDAKPFMYPQSEAGTEYTLNIDDILRMEKELKPKFTLICSPNNPTGNSIDLKDFEKLLQMNKDRIVCLDETYWGYSTDTTEVLKELLKKYDNLVIIRSFSKYYALAGIRIGYAFCGSKVKSHMKFYDKILGFNRISEKLVLAALSDKEYYLKINQMIIEDRDMLFKEINKLSKIIAYKSDANFLLIKVPSELSKPIDQLIKDRGLQIKFFSEPSFIDYARISIGTKEHSKIILSSIQEKVAEFTK